MDVTRKLAEFLITTGYADLPEPAISEAKVSFLDWLAVTLGTAGDPTCDGLSDVVRLVGGEPQATVLCRHYKTSILNAALLNGMASHVLDYDDTSIEFQGHPSVTLFPGLLALSEWKGNNGREFLTAYVLGFEIGCRVALGATFYHYAAGWHPTSTIGHFSAAAGIGKLLGLTTEQTIHAFGTAGTQAAGLKIMFGTHCKPFHAGKACFDGMLSALVAERGFISVNNILESEKGFWSVYASQHQDEKSIEGMGQNWYILKNMHKFHASCYETHASIEAALAMKKEYNIDASIIDQITVKVSPGALYIAAQKNPVTGLEAKFCISHTVANALLTMDTGIGAFTDEKAKDAKIVSLRDKIEVSPNDQLGIFEAEVTIRAGGKDYNRRFNLQTATHPFEELKEKIIVKFISLTKDIFTKSKIEEIIGRIENLENEKNMASFVALLNS
jgi:2-methylcitrate dehydratase PrpD